MMTKQQARKFKIKLDSGESPELPVAYDWVLKLTKNWKNVYWELDGFKESYRHYVFEAMKRLRQMGLLNQDFNISNFGLGYLYMIEEKEEEKLNKI